MDPSWQTQVNECGIQPMGSEKLQVLSLVFVFQTTILVLFLLSVGIEPKFPISIEFVVNILLFGVSSHLGNPTSICTIFKSRFDSRHKMDNLYFTATLLSWDMEERLISNKLTLRRLALD